MAAFLLSLLALLGGCGYTSDLEAPSEASEEIADANDGSDGAEPSEVSTENGDHGDDFEEGSGSSYGDYPAIGDADLYPADDWDYASSADYYEATVDVSDDDIPHEVSPPETQPTSPPPPVAWETDTVILERYPSVFAPDTVSYGTTFDVEVQLTVQRETPEVECVDCPPLVLPEAESWDIDVILSGEGFEAIGGRQKSLVLRPRGDSTSAVFRLAALPSSTDERASKLRVSFWHGGAFLMEAVRPIVYHAPSVPPPAVETAVEDEVARRPAFELAREIPDLTIMVVQRQVVINSPYLLPRYDKLELADDFDAWLASRYAALAAAGRGIRATVEQPSPSREAKRFGRDLYALTPEAFRLALWALLDGPESDLKTLQILTDDPRFPWELVLPSRIDGSDEKDFLGLDVTVGRWHLQDRPGVTTLPQRSIGLEETVVVAPEYDTPLAAVAGELEVLTAFAAHTAPLRRVAARRSAVEELLDAPRPGIIHFAGHGLASVVGDAGPRYSLELEDGPLFLDTVRGGQRWQPGIHPFVFVNACDVGRADRYGGFLEGWAPAMVDAGAVGYLGALWPVADAAAASFAHAFYDQLEAKIEGGRGRVADAVRDARRRYRQEPDPSYLAYVYYGDVGLLFSTVPESNKETP